MEGCRRREDGGEARDRDAEPRDQGRDGAAQRERESEIETGTLGRQRWRRQGTVQRWAETEEQAGTKSRRDRNREMEEM